MSERIIHIVNITQNVGKENTFLKNFYNALHRSAAASSLRYLLFIVYLILIGWRMTVFHFSDAIFLASERYISWWRLISEKSFA